MIMAQWSKLAHSKVTSRCCYIYIYIYIYIFVCVYFSIVVKIDNFENFDLENIITPVNAQVLQDLLVRAKYDQQKTAFLVDGFTNGFSLKYERNLTKVKREAPNLKLRVGSKEQLWNKVMAEVKLGRYAGPFKEPPFNYYVQSPIGLVPKDKGKKTRLIFHLLYPKTGESVNSGIPKEECSVKYPDFDEAVKLCLIEGKSCAMGKSDMSSAFRHVPLKKSQWYLLVMKASHPESGEKFYFVDKCLPFGSSISCAIFQAISDAIAFIVEFRTGKPNVNYLDDYLFVAWLKRLGDEQLRAFSDVCEEIRFPVALEKTFWGCTILTFLGLLLDSESQTICIPMDKVIKALDMVEFFLNKKNKKATVLQFQKLCGSLNFLCRCVVPGRCFLRRIYAVAVGNNLKPHHHHHHKSQHISPHNQVYNGNIRIWTTLSGHLHIQRRPTTED